MRRFTVTGSYDGWDNEGAGETLSEALDAFAKNCRVDAQEQRRMAEFLESQAALAEKMAKLVLVPRIDISDEEAQQVLNERD